MVSEILAQEADAAAPFFENLAALCLSMLNLTGVFVFFFVACHAPDRDRMTLLGHSIHFLSTHVVCKFQLAGSYRSHAGVSYGKEDCTSARDMTF